MATEGLLGVTAIDKSVAGPTVSVVCPVTDDKLADMLAEPTVRAVATPREPLTLLILAIDVDADCHVTWVVRSTVELSV